MRTGPAPHNNPHSLQVGSHLPLQHRNSFCVSALSHQSSLYSSSSCSKGYSSLSCGVSPDPFTFSPPHRMHFDELPSEVRFLFLLGSKLKLYFECFVFSFLYRFVSFSRRLPTSWKSSSGPGRPLWPTVSSTAATVCYLARTPLKWI